MVRHTRPGREKVAGEGRTRAPGALTGLALVLATGCGLIPREGPVEAFPLRKGTRWEYRGAELTAEGRREVALTMKVESARVEDGAVSATVSGDLLDDAAWREGGAPGSWTLTRRGGRYTRATGSGGEGVLFLTLPLVEGQEICPDERPLPPGACWTVESSATETIGVKGAPAALRGRYRLVRRDRAASRFLEVVPGIGITAYGVEAGPRSLRVTLLEVELR
jgi:hypothetical protein